MIYLYRYGFWIGISTLLNWRSGRNGCVSSNTSEMLLTWIQRPNKSRLAPLFTCIQCRNKQRIFYNPFSSPRRNRYRTLYMTVRGKFESFFMKRRNIVYEWCKFNRRCQEEGESAPDLYALAEHCGYGDLRDELIQDRLVVGIRDSSFQNSYSWMLISLWIKPWQVSTVGNGSPTAGFSLRRWDKASPNWCSEDIKETS